MDRMKLPRFNDPISPYKMPMDAHDRVNHEEAVDEGVFEMDLTHDDQHSTDEQHHVLVCGPMRSGKTSFVNVMIGMEDALKEAIESPSMPSLPIHYRARAGHLYQLEIHLISKPRWCALERRMLDHMVANYVQTYNEHFKRIGQYAQHNTYARILAQMYSVIDQTHVNVIAKMIDMVHTTQGLDFDAHDDDDDQHQRDDAEQQKSNHRLTDPSLFAQELRDYVAHQRWPPSMDVQDQTWQDTYRFENLTLSELIVLMTVYVTTYVTPLDIAIKLLLQHSLSQHDANVDTTLGLWRRITMFYNQVFSIEDMTFDQQTQYTHGCSMISEAHRMSQRWVGQDCLMLHASMFDCITCLWPMIDHLEIDGPFKIPPRGTLVDMPSNALLVGHTEKLVRRHLECHLNAQVHLIYACQRYQKEHYDLFERLATRVGWPHVTWMWTCVDDDLFMCRFDHMKTIKSLIRQSYGRRADEILDQLKFYDTSRYAYDASQLRTMIAIKCMLTNTKLHMAAKQAPSKQDFVQYLTRLSGHEPMTRRLDEVLSRTSTSGANQASSSAPWVGTHVRRRLNFDADDHETMMVADRRGTSSSSMHGGDTAGCS